MFNFDLQLFAEETEETEVQPVAEETPIPEELADLPEDVQAAAMEEIKASEKQEPQLVEETPQDTPPAQAESETKQSGVEKPKGKIPYARFQEQVEKTRGLEAEIEKLRAQLSSQSAQPVQTPQIQQAQQQVPQMPRLRIDKALISKIDLAAQKQAQEMLGWSDAEVEKAKDIYAEDNEENADIWEKAVGIARGDIYNDIRRTEQRQQAAMNAAISEYQSALDDYKTYAANERSNNADFENIRQYAVGDFFNKQSVVDKNIIKSAYDRLNSGNGTPADIYCIRNFYDKAKYDYRSSHGASNNQYKTAPVETKIKQTEKFPRSGQVAGTASTEGNAYSIENLKHLLDTTKWDDIPEGAKELLMGASMYENRG